MISRSSVITTTNVIATLIGFNYAEQKELPGALLDIVAASKWAVPFVSKINVLTDKIDQDNLESDVKEFYKKQKITIVKNGIGLLDEVRRILKDDPDKKHIIYYSGHAIHNFMLMPDDSYLPFHDFRKCICNILNDDAHVFCILDCCNPSGFSLPYILSENRFLLVKNHEYGTKFCTQPFLLITSANTNEKSAATKYGSIFSKYLFELLTDMNSYTALYKNLEIPLEINRNLHRLVCNLNSKIKNDHRDWNQTISIYSSLLIDPILPFWIGNNPINVTTDETLTTLIISRN